MSEAERFDIPFETENRLKNGDVRAVVATASLELGIDIGSVDLVVQLGSPRAIGVALQVGRSGHWIGAKPEGRLFATTRDELIECGAVHAMRKGAMDALRIPVAPLDVLAQQLVATCSGDDWDVNELYAMVRSTQPYRDLPRKDFDDVLTTLADGIATSRGRSGAFLHRDRAKGRVRLRRGSRMPVIMSGGARFRKRASSDDTRRCRRVGHLQSATIAEVAQSSSCVKARGET